MVTQMGVQMIIVVQFQYPKEIIVKFMFSKKATKIDEILTVNLTLCSKCQLDGEDFFIFVAFLENTNFNNFFPSGCVTDA